MQEDKAVEAKLDFSEMRQCFLPNLIIIYWTINDEQKCLNLNLYI